MTCKACPIGATCKTVQKPKPHLECVCAPGTRACGDRCVDYFDERDCGVCGSGCKPRQVCKPLGDVPDRMLVAHPELYGGDYPALSVPSGS